MPEKFKLGEIVYDKHEGLGKVTCITIGEHDSLIAVWNDIQQDANLYTLCGRRNLDDLEPTLFTLQEAHRKGLFSPVGKILKREVRYELLIYGGGRSDKVYLPEQLDAVRKKYGNDISFVKLTREWEEEAHESEKEFLCK
jgi:hypothetical protein